MDPDLAGRMRKVRGDVGWKEEREDGKWTALCFFFAQHPRPPHTPLSFSSAS